MTVPVKVLMTVWLVLAPVEVSLILRDYREKVVEPPEQSGNDRLTLSTVGVNVNQP